MDPCSEPNVEGSDLSLNFGCKNFVKALGLNFIGDGTAMVNKTYDSDKITELPVCINVPDMESDDEVDAGPS